MHPYLIEKYYGSDAISALSAARSFANSLNIPLMEAVFLSGYSEGGYATLAIQKRFEEDGIAIAGSAPAAGPYNLLRTFQTVIQSISYPTPFYLPFIYYAFENEYNLSSIGLDIGSIFQPRYNSMELLNRISGNYDNLEANDYFVSKHIMDIVVPDFIENWHTLERTGDEVFDILKEKVRENSIHTGWQPVSKTLFYTCNADEQVSP